MHFQYEYIWRGKASDNLPATFAQEIHQTVYNVVVLSEVAIDIGINWMGFSVQSLFDALEMTEQKWVDTTYRSFLLT